MMKKLLNNWKTTAAGLTMIGSSVIHLAFQIRAHEVNENAVTIAFLGVLGGCGFIFAGDASASQPKESPTIKDETSNPKTP
jgi:hypothetical protein